MMLARRNDDLAFGAGMVIDADIDPIEEAGQVLTQFAQCAADGWRIEDGTRTGQRIAVSRSAACSASTRVRR